MGQRFTAALWAAIFNYAIATHPIQLETRGELTSRLQNVHLSFDKPVDGLVTYTYGSCSSRSKNDAKQTIGTSEGEGISRLVWVIPEEYSDGGCISAWNEHDKLVGQSKQQEMKELKRKDIRRRSKVTAS